jgi:hypothetical protein
MRTAGRELKTPGLDHGNFLPDFFQFIIRNYPFLDISTIPVYFGLHNLKSHTVKIPHIRNSRNCRLSEEYIDL